MQCLNVYRCLWSSCPFLPLGSYQEPFQSGSIGEGFHAGGCVVPCLRHLTNYSNAGECGVLLISPFSLCWQAINPLSKHPLQHLPGKNVSPTRVPEDYHLPLLGAMHRECYNSLPFQMAPPSGECACAARNTYSLAPRSGGIPARSVQRALVAEAAGRGTIPADGSRYHAARPLAPLLPTVTMIGDCR